MQILLGRIKRVAAAGRLRVDEKLAATIIHATASGVVLSWLSQPEEHRDPQLLTAMREAMVAAVTYQEAVIETLGRRVRHVPCAPLCRSRLF